MVRGRIRQGQNNERIHPAWRGDSARLPFIIVSTFLVRGKNCLLKINSRCSRSNTKLMESVPLRDKNCLWGERGVLFSRLLVTDVAVSVKTCTWPNVQYEHAAADRRQGSERGRWPVPPTPGEMSVSPKERCGPPPTWAPPGPETLLSQDFSFEDPVKQTFPEPRLTQKTVG